MLPRAQFTKETRSTPASKLLAISRTKPGPNSFRMQSQHPLFSRVC